MKSYVFAKDAIKNALIQGLGNPKTQFGILVFAMLVFSAFGIHLR